VSTCVPNVYRSLIVHASFSDLVLHCHQLYAPLTECYFGPEAEANAHAEKQRPKTEKVDSKPAGDVAQPSGA
jgi:hypothetical protein